MATIGQGSYTFELLKIPHNKWLAKRTSNLIEERAQQLRESGASIMFLLRRGEIVAVDIGNREDK